MPEAAISELNELLDVYRKWISDMAAVTGDRDKVVKELVSLFNGYKFHVDFNLIFSSSEDFLYRQKGQLKLDNTVIEEFLPHLVSKAFPELSDVEFGQTKWAAKIGHKNKLINVGTYTTKAEAISARLEYEKALGYHENHGT